jgi:outer membrane protein assembly factor BamD (BamD/ComL family)
VVAKTPAALPAGLEAARAASPAMPATLAGSSAIEAPAPAGGANAGSATAAIDAREEMRLVSAARETLRAGSATRALELLDEARRRFPSGTLVQEREALTIEAMARSGQRDAAVARARAFARDYPGSPYTARVQAVLTAP